MPISPTPQESGTASFWARISELNAEVAIREGETAAAEEEAAELRRRLAAIADTLHPLTEAAEDRVRAGEGEYVGVNVLTLRRLFALAEGRAS